MTADQVVWESTVDRGRFEVKVTRIDGYNGRLTVRVVETPEILLDEQVGLSFEARFGPDVADVELWQKMGIDAIDNYINAADEV